MQNCFKSIKQSFTSKSGDIMRFSRKFGFMFILTISLLSFSCLISQEQGKSRYSPDRLKNIISSSTRLINELNGSWEKSYDDKQWETTTVPNTDYNKDRVIYKKNLQFDNKLVKNYTWSLYFLGLDDNVEVYLNEQLIGKYFGGMTPFTVKIPQNLIYNKTNILKLVVTPADDYSAKIRELNIYSQKLSIGLIREVFLIATPHIWVKDINFKTKINSDNSSAQINTKVNIASGEINSLLSQSFLKDSLGLKMNGKTSVDITAVLKNKTSGETVSESVSQQVEFENERAVTLNYNFTLSKFELWSPATPNLYEVYVKVSKSGKLIDDLSQSLGLYNLQVTQSGFLLNGNPFVIKGVDYVEDHIATGQSLSPYRMEQDVISMKTLGANLIRFKQNAPHPYFAYLCDKYGMMISVETPLYNVPDQLLNFYEVRSRMNNIAERLALNYDYHPSLFAYGIGEGIIESNPKTKEYFNTIIKTIRNLSTKPIFKNVLLGSKIIDTDGIDFIGIKDNREFLSNQLILSKILKIKEIVRNKPIVLNYGFPIQPLNSNGYTDPLTVEAQRYYILSINNIVKNNALAGSIFWSFNDFELNNPLITTNNEDSYLCSSGLFDRDRRQRLSYSTLQIIYTDQNEQPILSAGSYSESTPYIFLIAGLILALSLGLFIRRFKRFREYLFRAILRPYNFYADIRDQRIISIGQTFWLAFVNSITIGLFFSAIMYYFRTSDIAQSFYNLIFPFKWLQISLYKLIWQPELLSLIIAAIGFLTVFIIAGIIRVFALFVKSRIYYTDTIAITVWASTPLIILLPISIVLIKVLVFLPAIAIPMLALTLLIYLWIIVRILKATAVVFDVKSLWVNLIGGGFIFLIVLLKLLYLNHATSLFNYMDYLVKYIFNT